MKKLAHINISHQENCLHRDNGHTILNKNSEREYMVECFKVGPLQFYKSSLNRNNSKIYVHIN